MRRIFIFNPETDYALAAGNTVYNPPMKIMRLRKEMQLIQAYVASANDIIAVTKDFSIEDYPDAEHIRTAKKKNLSIITINSLPDLINRDKDEGYKIIPWGWNHSLRKELLSTGFAPQLLQSEEEIDRLRALSHRRTVIPFQTHLQKLLPDQNIPLAREFFNVAEALDFADSYPTVYFKAPWSSSGRGILRSDRVSKEKLREWIGGFIRKQGSVTGEEGFERKADFAIEWLCENGKAGFLGYSMFKTGQDGRYLGNEDISQEEIASRIRAMSAVKCENIIEAQKKTLDKYIAPNYRGPVGIDMLIDTEGKINPCVEINLRMTMGMISLGRLI